MIGGIPWSELKEQAMQDDYMTQSWYLEASQDEKETLKRLVDAQRQQGNMLQLYTQMDHN